MAITFMCGHCGKLVPPLAVAGRGKATRNSCPECHWSEHSALGEPAGYPPCGNMMRPHLIDEGERVTWRCLGCGFTMTGPSEQTTDEIASGRRYSADARMYGRNTPDLIAVITAEDVPFG